MARVATWSMLFLGYYSMISIVIFCLSLGGMFTTETMQTNTTYLVPNSSSVNSTLPAGGNPGIFGVGDAIWDLFKFTWFSLDLGLGIWNALVSFIFIWIPAILFFIIMLFAIRSGSS